MTDNARTGGSTQPGASTTTMSSTLLVSKPWSICAVPLLAAPTLSFVNLKTVQVISDPVNGTTNPKYILGAKGPVHRHHHHQSERWQLRQQFRVYHRPGTD